MVILSLCAAARQRKPIHDAPDKQFWHCLSTVSISLSHGDDRILISRGCTGSWMNEGRNRDVKWKENVDWSMTLVLRIQKITLKKNIHNFCCMVSWACTVNYNMIHFPKMCREHTVKNTVSHNAMLQHPFTVWWMNPEHHKPHFLASDLTIIGSACQNTLRHFTWNCSKMERNPRCTNHIF